MKIYLNYIITAIFLCLSFASIAQKTNYEAEWKKIEALIEKERRPQTALIEVKKLYERARAENNAVQHVKSLVYLSALQEETREENHLASIKDLEKELITVKEPARSIVYSLLAGKYWSYFQINRWKLYSRTQTIGFVKEDIATWSTQDFHEKIAALYLQSIRNQSLLQQTSLQAYDPILRKGNARNLRPTLYDLLAHQALRYFENDERNIKKPVYAFEIEQPQAFAPAKDFIAFDFKTRDSLSLHHKALLIYQQLIAFHLKNNRTDALVDVDLKRIQFVYSNSTHEDKQDLYEKALMAISNGNRGPSGNQARYLLAAHYNQLASGYEAGKDTSNKYGKLKAKALLETTVKDSSIKNEGWINSYNLLNEITRNDFSFELEKVNLPGQPFRVLVSYRNLSSISFRVVRITAAMKKQMERGWDDAFWNLLLQTNALRSWGQALPDPKDLQQHKVEVKADALSLGEYILIASTENFQKKQNLIGAQFFHVSNISYINNDNAFFILNRNTGEPIKNAKAEAFERIYNYNDSRFSRTRIGAYSANSMGLIHVESNKTRNNGFFLDVWSGNDTLAMQEHFYQYHYYDQPENKAPHKIFFFTDRSIYRPGQQIHFKGITLAPEKEHNSIAVDFKTTIYLRDANYQMIDSIAVTTNEFGSFSGIFKLPQQGLTGSFFIMDKGNRNQVEISVEEYKRPKFNIEFLPITQTYIVNDTVSISGVAKAYAGNTIDGASVNYRVVRQPRFIYPGWHNRSWLPQTAPMEITNGSTVTDVNGNFTIRFVAVPDKKISRKLDPLFDYVVYADITDINGETRSNEKRITAAYKHLVLYVDIPPRIIKDSLSKIKIRTENLNGVFQPSFIKARFVQLIPEKRLIRPRYWSKPDQFVMDKATYIALFPHDEYHDESDPSTWQKSANVYSHNDSLKTNGSWNMSNKQIPAGFYELTIQTQDKKGDTIQQVLYVEVFEEGKVSEKPTYFTFHSPADNKEPGEIAQALFSSSLQVFLLRHIDKNKKLSVRFSEKDVDHHIINNEVKIFTYPIQETDRGGFGVKYFFVKHNRFFSADGNIIVPWTNKELDITYHSFRDKTLPGSNETWKLTIKGKKNESIAAEMLAGMYDASLDQFKNHQWQQPAIWYNYTSRYNWNTHHNFTAVNSFEQRFSEPPYRSVKKVYDQFIFDHGNEQVFTVGLGLTRNSAESRQDGMISKRLEGRTMGVSAAPPAAEMMAQDAKAEEQTQETITKVPAPADPIQVRTNLNETAFFFPHLRTDNNGNIEFSFTVPEALTRWKMLSMAHSKDLAFGSAVNEIITQKELMVQPNAPRFLRQGDRIEFSTKVVNLSEKEMTGQVQLQLFDASTNQSVDGYFLNTFPNQFFTVAAGQSEDIRFPVQVPFQFNSTLSWRIVAVSGNFSDGEENILPVLSNRMLVTETMPLHIRGSGSKTFSFDKLKNASASNTLQHHSLTVEYTGNPTWFAVQALPFLAENTNESSEQVWSRYYANALASGIANSIPRIKAIFDQWSIRDTAALLSNLLKNEELKSILIQETPWVLAAQNETEQKRNIALLFDMVRMDTELQSNLQKLKNLQSPNGGFVWFKGGPDDRHITQYIVTGIGRLRKLNYAKTDLNAISTPALNYLDRKIKEDYDRLLKSKGDLSKQQISPIQIQYLYMRSFFSQDIPAASKTAFQYYLKQAKQFWVTQNKYLQGMTALALFRSGDSQTPAAILRSLKETSITDPEMGMYWKDIRFGYSWSWQYAPIETQALLIEAFSEISKDVKSVDDMKTWLIKNKQTTHWKTSKATADACYAMLIKGSDWIAAEPRVSIALGNVSITNSGPGTEAGTGYFKTALPPKSIEPSMGTVNLSVQYPVSGEQTTPVTAPSWGAVYWQYFEDLNKITFAETPLKLNKKLFIEKHSDRGPVLTPVHEGMELKIGDKIIVRIELRSDRDMEYVHMKDMRASSLEPVNVLSGYQWQGGLGYYESTRDASTNFFFHYLPKGTYVFEYTLFVSHKGAFSNGITTIQSMYAPEFTAHSEGVKINVD
jgi:hypothetical protein